MLNMLLSLQPATILNKHKIIIFNKSLSRRFYRSDTRQVRYNLVENSKISTFAYEGI